MTDTRLCPACGVQMELALVSREARDLGIELLRCGCGIMVVQRSRQEQDSRQPRMEEVKVSASA